MSVAPMRHPECSALALTSEYCATFLNSTSPTYKNFPGGPPVLLIVTGVLYDVSAIVPSLVRRRHNSPESS